MASKVLEWEMLHPQMSLQAMGFLPYFIYEDDPRSAAEQINQRYKFGGWKPTSVSELTKIDVKTGAMTYPGDPVMHPLAKAQLRDETIYFYQSSWVAIVQKDGSHELDRID